jgi:heterodisulfide reductase subunit C
MDEVLKSNSIWVCSSCYACTVECPKEIRITDIMYALKQRAIQQKVYPRGFPIPVLAQEFYKMVHTWGRTTENRLVMSLYRKTNMLQIFKRWRLGFRLFRRGRFAFKAESIKGRDELAKVLDAVEAKV